MRVIAGDARGRALLAPKGLGTRPMMDIVKGSLFNMLEAMDEVEGRGLDLFSGSGSLGIEALSRGADWVDFVENDREACKVIQANLVRLGLADRGHVIAGSVERLIGGTASARAGRLAGPYRIIFMDAPYAQKVSLGLLQALARGPVLSGDGVICVGHHRQEDLPDELDGLERVKHRRFGASCISIYRRSAGVRLD